MPAKGQTWSFKWEELRAERADKGAFPKEGESMACWGRGVRGGQSGQGPRSEVLELGWEKVPGANPLVLLQLQWAHVQGF